MSYIETAIVGAGPYGLSLAAHLGGRGLPFAIIGKPMESWRSFMPAGMILKSEPMASSLWDPAGEHSLEQFPRASGRPYQPSGNPLALSDFLAYADWFQKRAVPDIRQTYVTKLRQDGDGGFAMELADGGLVKSRKVVLATGHAPFRKTPETLARLPAELASHSLDVTDPQQFAGREVVIVGLGQSALETAALLFEAGAHVRVLGRAAEVAWNGPARPFPTWLDQIKAPDAGLGAGWASHVYSEYPWAFRRMPAGWRYRKVKTSWGPSGAWWLRERIVGKVPVQTGVRIDQAQASDGRLKLRLRGADGLSEIAADHVVACTGFDVDFDRLPYIEAGLREKIALRDKAPVLTSSFETSVRGLYAIGLPSAPTFGPSLRFMYGAKFAARALTHALANREVSAQAGWPRPAAARRG